MANEIVYCQGCLTNAAKTNGLEANTQKEKTQHKPLCLAKLTERRLTLESVG